MTDKRIASPQNEHVKHLAALQKDGRLRNEFKHFLVEGPRFVEAALEASRGQTPKVPSKAREAVAVPGTRLEIEELLYSPNLAGENHPLAEKAAAKGIKIVELSKDCYKKIADVKEPQGLAALVRFPEYQLEKVLARPDGLYLVACGVQDPGNLGAMIRSADAAGAAGVLVIRPAADIYNSKVVRATAGSILNLPVIAGSEEEVLGALAAAKVRLLVAEAGGEADVRKANWSRPVAVAIGSEAAGFSPAVKAAAAGSVKIPMWGRTESLNAAAAAAVCLYAARWAEGAPQV